MFSKTAVRMRGMALWLFTLASAGASAGVFVAPAIADDETAWRTIDVEARPVGIGIGENIPDLSRLSYIGGVILSSEDRDFGGFSGLHIDLEGARLEAVSDKGYWLQADFSFDAARGDIGLANVQMAPLTDPAGRPLSRKTDADAEGLLVTGDEALVSFEQNHRLWRYRRGANDLYEFISKEDTPADLNGAPSNGGLEAFFPGENGDLVLMTERLKDETGALVGWRKSAAGWTALSYRAASAFSVTDATRLGDDVIILERAFSPARGVRARLVSTPKNAFREGEAVAGEELARLGRGAVVDNFEGVAAVVDEDGRRLIFIMSDDNFNALQRTLLMAFEITAS
ncbi:MAG: esterase-like activity of phytase family protein [Pseudomonadota bacterium]